MSILLEQEVKFRLSSWEDGVARLERVSAELSTPRHFESNQLFDFPDSRLEKRGEALRLRRVGEHAWLTWKGPHHGSGRIKQRREVETSVEDASALEAILETLGLRERFRYEKYRATYRLADAHVTLDGTPIGVFMEIEGSPEQIAEAASRLSLDVSEALPLTYPRLYQLHRLEEPGAPEFMVFSEELPKA